MTRLEEILEANKEYVSHPENNHEGEPDAAHLPRKKIAVYSCMDTRLTGVLEPAMGIGRSDAKVIRSVGNYITGEFDAIIRSFMVATYELGVEEIFVVGHYECGMEKTTAASLSAAMRKNGIAEDAIERVKPTLQAWADAFNDPVQNVKNMVELLKKSPYLPKTLKIHGLMMHPRTGKIDVIVNGY